MPAIAQPQTVDTTKPSVTKPPESSAVRVAGIVLTALLGVLLAAFLARGAVSAYTAAQMWAYPFQFDESEGMIVAETMLLDRGVPIYDIPGPDLFIAAPYPPLFYLLNLPGQHLAGAEPTFKVGRAISMLATIFVGLAVCGIIVATTRDRLAGALGAAAWWSLSLVTFWGSLVKPDMTAVALGLAGLWCLVASPGAGGWGLGASRRRDAKTLRRKERAKIHKGFLTSSQSLTASPSVWWALPFFLAAFYTKQTAIAGAVAGIAWLLVMRPRVGLKFGAAYAVGALIPSALLTIATQGGYYWHEGTFKGLPGLPDPVHNLPWMPDRFVEFVQNFLLTYALIMLPGMLALAYYVLRITYYVLRKVQNPTQYVIRNTQYAKPLLLLAYLAMSMVVASGTGTLGGNHNHLLDWAAAGCIGLGLGAALVRQSRLLPMRVGGALAALAVLVAVPALFSNPVWMQREFGLLQSDKRSGFMNIFQYVTNNGGAAYSDNVSLMLTTHKRLWTTDPYTQTHATLYGRWDESKLVAEIKRKGFSQVILRIDIFAPQPGAGDVSPGILQALRDNYKLDQRNVENIYIPR